MKILASMNTLSPSSSSAKVIFQLFVFRDPAERLLVERQSRPRILDGCYRSLCLFHICHAVLFDPFLHEEERLLSFTGWQPLQLRDDSFLKSHCLTSPANRFKLL